MESRVAATLEPSTILLSGTGLVGGIETLPRDKLYVAKNDVTERGEIL
jgi:hypothetical protein